VSETKTPLRPTTLSVDLDAVTRNAVRLREHAGGRPLIAVVKANAYGMGVIPVSRALSPVVAWLGVALVEEGVQIRQAGVDTPILMLGPAGPHQVGLALEHAVTLAVHGLGLLEAIEAAAAHRNVKADVHIKVDSGMGRLGFRPEEIPGLLKALTRCPHVQVAGMYSNLASADDPQNPQTAGQLERFLGILDELEKAGVQPQWIHLANSSGLLAHPGTHLTLCRPGLTLYGLKPSDLLPDIGLTCAVSLTTSLFQVKHMPAGAPVGYGGTYVTPSPQRIGILPVGYADGLPRVLGGSRGHVLISGAPCKILGRVSMDLTAVDLEPAGDVAEGATVTLWGADGAERLGPWDWARWSETIAYEVMIRINHRVGRRYLRGGRTWNESLILA
jgi:alanine racemase